MWPFGGRSQLHNWIFIRFLGNVLSWICLSVYWLRWKSCAQYTLWRLVCSACITRQLSVKIIMLQTLQKRSTRLLAEHFLKLFNQYFKDFFWIWYAGILIRYEQFLNEISLRGSKWLTNLFWRDFGARFKMANRTDSHLQPHFWWVRQGIVCNL